MSFWTALFSFFPAHAEAGKKKILNHFSRSLSPPHLPKKPAWPIPTQPYPASIMEEKWDGDPCPALEQGMANLSPTAYKYKGTRRRMRRGEKRKKKETRGGGKILEKEQGKKTRGGGGGEGTKERRSAITAISQQTRERSNQTETRKWKQKQRGERQQKNTRRRGNRRPARINSPGRRH